MEVPASNLLKECVRYLISFSFWSNALQRHYFLYHVEWNFEFYLCLDSFSYNYI